MDYDGFLKLANGGLRAPGWLLAEGSDARRRKVLRAHWEIPIDLKQELDLRQQVDGWLDRLKLLELLIATGETPEEEGLRWIGQATWTVLETPEVQRFIDDYDWFSVRLLMSRRPGGGGFLPRLPQAPAPHPSRWESAPAVAFAKHDQELCADRDVSRALKLLDDFKTRDVHLSGWRKHLAERADSAVPEEYESATKGIRRWIAAKVKMYRSAQTKALRREFALYDHYWLMKCFDCAVSTSGKISPRTDIGPPTDWMKLWGIGTASIRTLRQAWADANRKIQECSARGQNGAQPKGIAWPEAFEEELEELRALRAAREPGTSRPDVDDVRMTLTGLAFSGGGIRSATFNLGVLQALREMELLRHFDYLSTVSGGGYVGGWLVANTLRQRFWLRRGADWRTSIDHLRKYSNYLSPKVGLLSADSWAMFAIWSRNTFLMQLLVLLGLAAVLLLPYIGHSWIFTVGAKAFGTTGDADTRLGWQVAKSITVVLATVLASYNLRMERHEGEGATFSQGKTQRLIVLPYFIAAYLIAAGVWGQVTEGALRSFLTYGGFLTHAWLGEWTAGLAVAWVCLAMLGWWGRGHWWLLAASGGVATLYLGMCAVALIFRQWQSVADGQGHWLAFGLGPSLVLVVFTMTMVVHIGLMGRSSSDGQREWWSRLGAWFCIYGMIAAFLQGIAFWAPCLLEHWANSNHEFWKWPAIGTWIATTAGGLIAGRSAESNGSETGAKAKRTLLVALAAVGPPVFVAGLFALASWAVFSVLERLAGVEGLAYWARLDAIGSGWPAVVCLTCAAVALVLSARVDINIFSLNSFYKYRLSRCYLGASRPNRDTSKWSFTGFDPADDLKLSDLRHGAKESYTGPIPIINCAVNSGGSSDLSLHTRHAAAFTFTPLHAGSGWRRIGYARMVREDGREYCGSDHAATLAHVVSVSGAAANPNMGFHTSPAVAFLMTVFNLRLGAWFPHPGKHPYRRPSPRLAAGSILRELFGLATEEGKFLNLSDGGHFENLGIYELVRRRCEVIVACDAEADPDLTFGSLGNAIRLCETDLGARIDIDVSSIRKDGGIFSRAQCATGTILFDDGSSGLLIYLKASMTGCEETSIREYQAGNPDFPHETTGDQFFSEPQFDSYRRLGYAICQRAFRDCRESSDHELRNQILATYARRMQELWTPNLPLDGKFSHLGEAVQRMWEELRQRPELRPLLNEIMQLPEARRALTPAIYTMTQEIFQLMENAYMDLALGDSWGHPDHAGWRELFTRVARSPLMRTSWQKSKGTYGTRFQNFCRRWLELP